MTNRSPGGETDKIPAKKGNRLALFLKILFPILILAAGFTAAKHLYKGAPKAKRNRPAPRPPLVSVTAATKANHRVVVSAMGTVTPSKRIDLKSRLSGEVIHAAKGFTPGGLFKKGDLILGIDPADFRLSVRRHRSLVKRAKADLELEAGRRDVAREGLKLLARTSGRIVADTSLALRKPQLAQARADLETAKTALDQALLDLKRTEISAPFNAMVLEQMVEPGSQIAPREVLATLVGTDAYRIEAAIPMDRLRWIRIPPLNAPGGSRAAVKTRDGTERTGEVIRLLGDMNEESRMARVLIRVADPLGLAPKAPETQPLIIGSYVSLSIEGELLEGVVPVPRTALRDGNRIWLLEEGKLAVKNIAPVWRDRAFVYVKNGIAPGDLIIVSAIAAPVRGMPLRLGKEERITTAEMKEDGGS